MLDHAHESYWLINVKMWWYKFLSPRFRGRQTWWTQILDWPFHHFVRKKSLTHIKFESNAQLFLYFTKGKHGMLSPQFNHLLEIHLPIIVECVFCIHIKERKGTLICLQWSLWGWWWAHLPSCYDEEWYVQVEAHNAQPSFHQRCRNLSSCTQETSPASSPERHSFRWLFSGLRHSDCRMLCLSMRTLLQQVTPRTIHLQLKQKIKIKIGPKMSKE